MFWDIMEKIGIVLGIIAAIIEIANILFKYIHRSGKSLKQLYLSVNPDSFWGKFITGFMIMGIISIVILPLGLIFPNEIGDGLTILGFLGMLWLCFPFLILFVGFDD